MASYPLSSYHFQVVWGGANVSFQEVSGLNMNREKIAYRGGASPEYSDTFMPGRPTFDDIVMKRGIFKGDSDYHKWQQTIVLNEVERRDLTISLLGPDHAPVVTWKVKNAFPLKIEGPSFKSNANEVAIESITLAHEGVSVEYS
ncbi:MAG: phage tail protein [Bacteroidetes bacterium]|jgi:phage tail-like protein|nr:phage tail protein [Bacteroidota bacterium]MBL0019362.1 phage tail protein [Bacteroidota bacterium]MBP6639262.1 phage tail protein [Bacteroidia bacterium]